MHIETTVNLVGGLDSIKLIIALITVVLAGSSQKGSPTPLHYIMFVFYYILPVLTFAYAHVNYLKELSLLIFTKLTALILNLILLATLYNAMILN